METEAEEGGLLRGDKSSVEGHEVNLAVAGRPDASKKHLRGEERRRVGRRGEMGR